MAYCCPVNSQHVCYICCYFCYFAILLFCFLFFCYFAAAGRYGLPHYFRTLDIVWFEKKMVSQRSSVVHLSAAGPHNRPDQTYSQVTAFSTHHWIVAPGTNSRTFITFKAFFNKNARCFGANDNQNLPYSCVEHGTGQATVVSVRLDAWRKMILSNKLFFGTLEESKVPNPSYGIG